MNAFEQRLAVLGLTLPEPVAPVANYLPYVISGHLAFLSGQISVTAEGEIIRGRLGKTLTLEEGQKAARACGLNLIAQMKVVCDGDLSRVRRIVKLGGFVCADPAQTELNIPKIINGCSDLFVDVFGDRGRHARFAVSAPALPADCAVEIDAVIRIDT